MKNFGRVSVCGSISSYNTNPKNLSKGINYIFSIVIVYRHKKTDYFFSGNVATSDCV